MQTLLTGVCILYVNLIAGRNGHKTSGDLNNQDLKGDMPVVSRVMRKFNFGVW